MTYYQILWYFAIYSFLGWVLEVVYHAVHCGNVVNRGFLNGPVCPVYGFGVLAIFAASHIFRSVPAEDLDPLSIFIGGAVLATVVELIAGWVLYRLFHARWWDYSDKPFNIGGYICLEYSIIWGLGTLIVVDRIQPLVSRISSGGIPPDYGWPLLLIIYLLYFCDLIVTVLTVTGLNARLKDLDEIRGAMRAVSDRLSEDIGNETIDVAAKIGEAGVQADLAKAELMEKAAVRRDEVERSAYEKKKALREKADRIIDEIDAQKGFGAGRLLKAFPNARHHDYGDTLDLLRQRLRERREKRKQEKR